MTTTSTSGLVILIEQISALVNEEGRTWQDKMAEVLSVATPEDRDALIEFASWFLEDHHV